MLCISGQVILDKNQKIKTVVNKLKTIDTEFRNFQMELLAGEKDFMTTVREHGCSFTFDFSKVYWNTKLGMLTISTFTTDNVNLKLKQKLVIKDTLF